MTEILALVTAVVVLATAVTAWRTKRQVQQVHIMVNSQRAVMENQLELLTSQRTVMEARLDQLTQALQGSDTPVPPAPPPQERQER